MPRNRPPFAVRNMQTRLMAKQGLSDSDTSSNADAMKSTTDAPGLCTPKVHTAVKKRDTKLKKRKVAAKKRDGAVRELQAALETFPRISALPPELQLSICALTVSSGGTRLYPRHLPAAMLACRQLYADVGRITYRNILKLVESTGPLTQGAVARLRKYSDGYTKAVKISRIIKSRSVDGDATTSYVDFEAYLSPNDAVQIRAAPGKIAAKVPTQGDPGQIQRHTQ